jgi:hypothetical protein
MVALPGLGLLLSRASDVAWLPGVGRRAEEAAAEGGSSARRHGSSHNVPPSVGASWYEQFATAQLYQRDTRLVASADVDPPGHLIVRQDVFAGARFWTALDRLADGRGHDGHQRYLAGDGGPNNRYSFHCVTCWQVIATMVVQREEQSLPA